MHRLPRSWLSVDDIARVNFLNQVRAEIGADHDLAHPDRRPVNAEARCWWCRLMVKLTESGKLPEDAEDLLTPVYDPTVKGFQRAQGFRVPLEVVKLLLDANGGQMPPAST